jgi:hypothetical protein
MLLVQSVIVNLKLDQEGEKKEKFNLVLKNNKEYIVQ